MSAPEWTTSNRRMRSNSVTESSTPSQEAIDAYAQQVLKRNATEDCSPDESLGSYITSLLRMSMEKDVTQIPEYEGLVELLQEHCGLDSEEKAKEALQEICTTVVENRLPVTAVEPHHNGYYPAILPTPSSPPLRPNVPPTLHVDDEEEFPSLSEATATAQITPQRADSLIPLHLLDEDEAAAGEAAAQSSDDVVPENKKDTFPPRGKRTKAKKSLSSSASSTSSAPSHHNKPQPASDLAAALFHPARSRQSSIDESASSTSPHLAAVSTHINNTTTATQFSLAAAAAAVDPYQYEEVQNMLLAMTDGLSPQAAHEAAVLAQADVSAAHYVVQAAMTAPPICRHLLQAGCYRSDCSFSHNVGQHTCLFWLRGRCGKGEMCRFLHGFSEKLLPYNSEEYAQQEAYYASLQQQSQPSYGGYGDAATTPPAAASVSPPHPGSFANIASQGYSARASFAGGPSPAAATTTSTSNNATTSSIHNLPTVKIPGDLWNPHENRDAAAFYIADPVERFYTVMAAHPPPRDDIAIMDLHFQSTKTFAVVLQKVLPDLLQHSSCVWIITGTGHHVGSKTHQKGGGALESSVLQWLLDQTEYRIFRGKDRNGQGGAILVKR